MKIHARSIPGLKKRWSDCYRIVPEGGGLKALSKIGMKIDERVEIDRSHNRKSLDRLFNKHFCEYMDLRGNNDETSSLWTSYMESFGCVCLTVPRKYKRRHPILLDGDTEYVRVSHPYHPFWEDFWVPEDFATKALLLIGGFSLTGKELLQREKAEACRV
jgi:hypothetical protein